jgi:cytochrome c oxidase subunit 2
MEERMSDWLGLPLLASEHGGELDFTLGLVHLLMAALFVGWGVFFAYVLVRFRKTRNPTADYVGVTSKTSTWLEVGVAAAEALLLVGLAIPLWAARVGNFPAPQDATRVRVVGEQFAWNVHYPGPDGLYGRTDITLMDPETNALGLDREDPAAQDDVVTLNQLHLPVGTPALIELSSKDVIHSFALPEMRVKQDALPGVRIPVWFVPNVTTEEMRERTGNPEFGYEITCAQLCGLGHYRMRGYLTIHTAEGFQAWMDEQQAQLSESGGDDFWE